MHFGIALKEKKKSTPDLRVILYLFSGKKEVKCWRSSSAKVCMFSPLQCKQNQKEQKKKEGRRRSEKNNNKGDEGERRIRRVKNKKEGKEEGRIRRKRSG